MSKTVLPKKWLETTLGEVCIINPKNKLDDDDTVGFLPMTAVPQTYGDKPSYQTRTWSKAKKGYTHFQENDVLFAKVTPCFENGKSMIAEDCPAGVGSGSSELIVLRTEPNFVLPKLVLNLIRSYEFKQLGAQSMTGAVGLRRVPKAFVEQYPFPLPPLAEQREIARRLDELLAQVDTLKTRLDAIPSILKRFRQSTLAAATSGKLTEQWRGTSAIELNQSPVTIGQENDAAPKGWEWNKLLDLAKLESGHTPRKSIPEYWDGGDVYWICLQDIRAAHGTEIMDTKHKPTMLGIENSSARLLPKGTVCFSRDISVGYTTIMGHEMSTTQHFANWVCGEGLNNKYLQLSLMAAKGHLTLSGQGTTVKTIYMPALKEFQLLTPPLKEQAEIVRRVEELFAFADQVEQRVNDAQARVNHLTQSILAKAFRGELTSEWRTNHPDLITGENSAAALLKRIKTEREKQTPKKKTRKKK
jgi:type I restriction enzyme S subunit